MSFLSAFAALAAIGAPAPTAMTADACHRVAVQLEGRADADQMRRALDWPQRCRYADENAQIKQRPRMVLMGDSITEFWKRDRPAFFSAALIDRGISGQTSTQMLARFYDDVIMLKPRAVHILAGTNDIAGNTGPITPEAYQDNIRAMVDLAQAHGIRVVIGALLPADHFYWNPDLKPAGVIRAENGWLRQFARSRGLDFIDYYSLMATPSGGLRADFSNDGVHPNAAGYAVMEKALARELR
jgi:lysophospholipase L1-like esterase